MKRLFALIIQLSLILSLTACSLEDVLSPSRTPKPSIRPNPDTVTASTMERYRENELMEFEGIHLDPTIGPRDNSIQGIQEVDINSYKLKIDGLVETNKSYTYDQILDMDSIEMVYTIYCVEGWDATFLWKGVLLADVFSESKPTKEAKTVIFHAVDGYTTSLPLTEVIDNELLLAYQANGLALPASLGYPFMLMAKDKWGYKWARWINRIELSSDINYKGYWESRNYNNGGDLNEPY